jgi:hypothetical protein
LHSNSITLSKWNCTPSLPYVYFTCCYPKVPKIPLPSLKHLTKFIFAHIPFEVIPFGIDTAIPAGFPRTEALLEIISLQRLHHVLWFGLDLFNVVKSRPLLTYLLTLWSRVLLEKLTGFAANQEIHCFLWSSKVHYRTHKHPLSFNFIFGNRKESQVASSVE